MKQHILLSEDIGAIVRLIGNGVLGIIILAIMLYYSFTKHKQRDKHAVIILLAVLIACMIFFNVMI